jgi:NAD-reducing hydrogenase large subunit
MARLVTIEPVTRIEGPARVTISLDDDGRVTGAHVHVTAVRGFEAFCVGRLIREMPALTARICGICPVSHALAAAQAGDVILGAPPPTAARRLRALLQLAQLVQSHALSFFLLSAPDLVEPGGGDPARRNLFALAEDAPEVVRDGIALRSFGQQVIERVAGQRVHPAFAVPGGVAHPLDPAARDELDRALPAALSTARRTLEGWWERLARHPDAAGPASDLGGLFLALIGADGGLDLTEGALRVVSARGEVLADGVAPARYPELLGEAVEPWTYTKLAFWRPLGKDAGMYRVGPLARLNLARRCGTPLADLALARFRALAAGPVLSPVHAHLARLVEIVWGLEAIGALLSDPAILDREVLSSPGEGRPEGVGACEAPRGTLFHRYRVDAGGVVTFADLVVATGQNALAMNAAVREVAARWLGHGRIDEALLNRVEAVIRAFDPCLSCATHAAGGRTVALRLVGPRGEVLDEAPAER